MSKGKELLVHALDRLKHINYEDDHLTNDLIQTIQKYLTQPEQDNIQFLLDQVSRLTAENAMIKEKWLSKGDDEYINEESGYNRSDWWE